MSRNGGFGVKDVKARASSSRPSPLKFESTKSTMDCSVMLEVELPADDTIPLKFDRTVCDEKFVGLSTNVFGSAYSPAIFTVCNNWHTL